MLKECIGRLEEVLNGLDELCAACDGTGAEELEELNAELEDTLLLLSEWRRDEEGWREELYGILEEIRSLSSQYLALSEQVPETGGYAEELNGIAESISGAL